MRHAAVNSTIGTLRTPESILIDRERAAFRQAALDQALAAVASGYVRLIIQARYNLCWTWEQIGDEFSIDPWTAQRAHNRALEIMRRQLADSGVVNLRDIL